MAITTYAELQTAIGNYLMRTDCDEAELIALAESEMRTDYRLRYLTDLGSLTLSDGVALPADFESVESWRLNDSPYFHPLEVVSAELLGHYLAHIGATGVPRYVAVLNGTARFAPAPGDGYDSYLTYWSKLPALGGPVTTNWLLTDHPSIYLYGALKHSAPYLKEDERIATWQTLYEDAVEKRYMQQVREQFSGTMRIRPRRAIGG